jgi:hypothetical protein
MTVIKSLGLLLILLLISVQPGYCWKFYSTDDPDTGLLASSYFDIFYNNGTIWLAGGGGLSYSTDFGQSWYTHTSNSGLNRDEPSAIFGRGNEVWVASTYFEMYEGVNFPFGDGINRSTDGGLTWADTLQATEISGIGRVIYDMDGTDSSTYAACFYGGFVVSHDNGQSWNHLFFSPADSLDWHADEWPELNSGRYYACVVDTSHEDTLMVYGGTAHGMQKFLYIPKRVKFGGRQIYDIVGIGDFIYLAHEGGVTQGNDSLGIYYTADTSNGLGGNLVKKLAYFGGKLWAAVFDSNDGSGLGLYYTSNIGASWINDVQGLFWTKANTNIFDGINSGVFDFNIYNNSVVYAAAGDSGIFRSLDFGLTWERFYTDSLDINQSSRRNQVYSIDLTSDSLYLGTKAGLVKASYVAPFMIDYQILMTFPEHDSSGSFVSLVRHNDGTNPFTWVAVEPIDPDSDSGNYAALMIDTSGTIVHSVYFEVSDSITVIAAGTGLFASLNSTLPPMFVYNVSDQQTGLTLFSYEFLVVDQIGDKLYTGTSGGYGYRRTNNDWAVFQANTDPKKHDLAVGRTNANSGLPGDWVVAIELQDMGPGLDPVLWTACRRVPDTIEQKSGIAFSSDFGDSWQSALIGEQVWNFTFKDSTVFAAATGGLFYAEPPWTEWIRDEIVDQITEDTLIRETEIFAAAVIDSILWVGSARGLARRNIDDPNSWSITRIHKSTTDDDRVFAAPVPYSPVNFSGRLTLHYHVERDAEVTVEIYDFAMNLVRVVAENRPRTGGSDYFETWDGYNGNGDMVATGMYFFKVSLSTGEQHWGRLAIIP